MRSRAVRLTLSAAVIGVLAAAAFFTFQTEQEISARRSAARLFEERVRAIDRALAEVRAGQQAYVAAGQSAELWMPKVAALAGEAAQGIDDLRATAATADARASLMEAAATAVELARVDRRALEYLRSGQDVMAADVVYAEGAQTVALAATQVDAARALEQHGMDEAERDSRQRQLYAVSTAAVVAAGGLLLLGAAPSRGREASPQADPVQPAAPAPDELSLRVREDFPRHAAPTIRAASEICTEIARVRDPADLATLLGRAGELMDASGLVIWMGTPGGDLRAALAHGYPAQTVARMPAVPKNAGNAAAAAYRTGALQIVLARPGTSSGALVAPLLTPDGCIGALSAEIKGRGETSDTTQALAVLFAAQLSSVLAPAAPAAADAPADRMASA